MHQLTQSHSNLSEWVFIFSFVLLLVTKRSLGTLRTWLATQLLNRRDEFQIQVCLSTTPKLKRLLLFKKKKRYSQSCPISQGLLKSWIIWHALLNNQKKERCTINHTFLGGDVKWKWEGEHVGFLLGFSSTSGEVPVMSGSYNWKQS